MTVAAAGLSLVVAVVVAAVVAWMDAEFTAAKAARVKLQAEYQLDGAQQFAALALGGSAGVGPFRWRSPAGEGDVEVLAEPEAAKLSLAAAAEGLDEQVIRRLGVIDSRGMRDRLRQLAEHRGVTVEQMLAVDRAPLWRACGASLASPYGLSETAGRGTPTAPGAGAARSRAGELWRLRTISRSGWSDDRLVRFTGDARKPVAVVERRFSRAGSRTERCAAILSDSAS